MQSQYENERQVKAVINRYHHEAARARHSDQTRHGKPDQITAIGTSLRSSFSSMLSSLPSRIGQQHAAAQAATAGAADMMTEPLNYCEWSPSPVENPATA
jgi:hypothetical protein